jgi:hypothetical protein
VKEEATEAKGDKGEANKADEKEPKGKQREPSSDMCSTQGSLETECHDSASGYENNTGGSNESSTLPLQGHLQQTVPRAISGFDLI